MPSKARCSKCSLSCGTKENLISSLSCLTAAALTFPLPGPTLLRRHRVRSHHARLWLVHRTCCGCASLLTVCCTGSKPVRPQTKIRQPRRTIMQRPQLELWSAEPHPTPPIYQQLTPHQRSRLISHLAELIFKLVQDPPTLPPPPTQSKHHER